MQGQAAEETRGPTGTRRRLTTARRPLETFGMRPQSNSPWLPHYSTKAGQIHATRPARRSRCGSAFDRDLIRGQRLTCRRRARAPPLLLQELMHQELARQPLASEHVQTGDGPARGNERGPSVDPSSAAHRHDSRFGGETMSRRTLEPGGSPGPDPFDLTLLEVVCLSVLAGLTMALHGPENVTVVIAPVALALRARRLGNSRSTRQDDDPQAIDGD
jgi:hypothetical protein